MNRPYDAEDEGYVSPEHGPDYLLSEAGRDDAWEPPSRPWLRPMLVAISLLVVATIIVPLLLQVGAELFFPVTGPTLESDDFRYLRPTPVPSTF